MLRIALFAVICSAVLALASCTTTTNTITNTNTSRAANASTANNSNEAKVENTANSEQEISTLLDQYNEALLKKDAATLDKIWADDLSFVNLRGQLLTKKERLENIKTGATELKSAQVAEKNVRVYGNTAVATLVVNIDGQYSGQEGAGSFRITTVWAKPKGTWQMVAVQMTPIAK